MLKKGTTLYEEIIQKNFQIIETFMAKIPGIIRSSSLFYIEQQETDVSLALLQEKHEELTRAFNQFKLDSKDDTKRQPRRNNSFKVETEDKSMKVDTQKLDKFTQYFENKLTANEAKISTLTMGLFEVKSKSVAVGKLTTMVTDRIDVLEANSLTVQQLSKTQLSIENVLSGKIMRKIEQEMKQFRQCFEVWKQESKEEWHVNFERERMDLRLQIWRDVNKKADLVELNKETGLIKRTIEGMAEESANNFANKEQTRRAMILFEKRLSRLDLAQGEKPEETKQQIMTAFGRSSTGWTNEGKKGFRRSVGANRIK